MKDDRGELDLTKQIDELHATIAGFQHLVSVQKLEIAHLKKYSLKMKVIKISCKATEK